MKLIGGARRAVRPGRRGGDVRLGRAGADRGRRDGGADVAEDDVDVDRVDGDVARDAGLVTAVVDAGVGGVGRASGRPLTVPVRPALRMRSASSGERRCRTGRSTARCPRRGSGSARRPANGKRRVAVSRRGRVRGRRTEGTAPPPLTCAERRDLRGATRRSSRCRCTCVVGLGREQARRQRDAVGVVDVGLHRRLGDADAPVLGDRRGDAQAAGQPHARDVVLHRAGDDLAAVEVRRPGSPRPRSAPAA